ncbi:MAG: hypothetical protein JXQ27_03105 [Acidobacteria bacterium]|nr:hypothetical protein [Acidobacteriota bacterium]
MCSEDTAWRRRLLKLKHDLVSPLTTIHGQLDLLLFKEKQLSPESGERIRKAIRSCDQIIDLLETFEKDVREEGYDGGIHPDC